MEFDFSNNGICPQVTLRGDLDDAAQPALAARVFPLLADRGSRLVIDLSGARRITSAGIGALVTLVARANTNGSRVILAAPTPFVAGVLKTTRLDTFFEIAETVEQAKQRLSS